MDPATWVRAFPVTRPEASTNRDELPWPTPLVEALPRVRPDASVMVLCNDEPEAVDRMVPSALPAASCSREMGWDGGPEVKALPATRPEGSVKVDREGVGGGTAMRDSGRAGGLAWERGAAPWEATRTTSARAWGAVVVMLGGTGFLGRNDAVGAVVLA